jgi:hypothetical protein
MSEEESLDPYSRALKVILILKSVYVFQGHSKMHLNIFPVLSIES